MAHRCSKARRGHGSDLLENKRGAAAPAAGADTHFGAARALKCFRLLASRGEGAFTQHLAGEGSNSSIVEFITSNRLAVPENAAADPER